MRIKPPAVGPDGRRVEPRSPPPYFRRIPSSAEDAKKKEKDQNKALQSFDSWDGETVEEGRGEVFHSPRGSTRGLSILRPSSVEERQLAATPPPQLPVMQSGGVRHRPAQVPSAAAAANAWILGPKPQDLAPLHNQPHGAAPVALPATGQPPAPAARNSGVPDGNKPSAMRTSAPRLRKGNEKSTPRSSSSSQRAPLAFFAFLFTAATLVFHWRSSSAASARMKRDIQRMTAKIADLKREARKASALELEDMRLEEELSVKDLTMKDLKETLRKISAKERAEHQEIKEWEEEWEEREQSFKEWAEEAEEKAEHLKHKVERLEEREEEVEELKQKLEMEEREKFEEIRKLVEEVRNLQAQSQLRGTGSKGE